MTETIRLAPHDAMPSGPGRQVIVLQRFEEERPGEVTVQIILTGQPEQSTHPRRPDGSAMSLDEAVAAAHEVAAQEGLAEVYVIDRLAGGREATIRQNSGDHSVDMEGLSDTDDEDGVRGADMRDIAHPSAS